MMKNLMFAISFLLFVPNVNAQQLECTTVMECAQRAVDIAAAMQTAVDELNEQVSSLRDEVSLLESTLETERAARIAAEQQLSAKFNNYIPFGGVVHLRSNYENLYLLSYNHRNRDELDVLMSGKTGNTAWTLER